MALILLCWLLISVTQGLRAPGAPEMALGGRAISCVVLTRLFLVLFLTTGWLMVFWLLSLHVALAYGPSDYRFRLLADAAALG